MTLQEKEESILQYYKEQHTSPYTNVSVIDEESDSVYSDKLTKRNIEDVQFASISSNKMNREIIKDTDKCSIQYKTNAKVKIKDRKDKTFFVRFNNSWFI